VTFGPGPTSRARLEQCDPSLARNIIVAYSETEVDFTVGETLRSQLRQRELFEKGLSRTLDSHHLPGPDGKSNAADLWPWIAGEVRFVERAGILVAQAQHRAQAKTSADITWGGVWDRKLCQLDVNDLEGEIEDYVARWRSKHPRPPGHVGGWSPLRDIWHFEVPRG
jgi:peptidoglycan L-alanyl-D-glutamate endopeptidase CwlK